MASEAQVRYAKSLMARADMSSNLYPIDTDTPMKAASWFIDQLKNGEEVSPSAWERKLSEYIEEVGPSSTDNTGDNETFDKSVWNPTLELIHSQTIKTFLTAMIDQIPDYFYTIPASSTGKYHPSFAITEGGLVKHTLSALQVFNELANNKVFLSELPRGGADMARASLLLHDNYKNGLNNGKYTRHNHPLIPRQVYDGKVAMYLDFDDDQKAVVNMILCAIESHMGPWTTGRNSDDPVLPEPRTPLEKTVHLCDYIASRKFMTLL